MTQRPLLWAEASKEAPGSRKHMLVVLPFLALPLPPAGERAVLRFGLSLDSKRKRQAGSCLLYRAAIVRVRYRASSNLLGALRQSRPESRGLLACEMDLQQNTAERTSRKENDEERKEENKRKLERKEGQFLCFFRRFECPAV